MIQLIFQLLILLFCLVVTRPGFSQEIAEPAIRLSADLVVLDTQVISKKTGVAIGNLRKEDFTIYEDGVVQEITHFSQDKLPLSILLLIDTSGSVWDLQNEMRQSMIDALRQLKESDEVAVMATASKTSLIQDFSKDRDLIFDKLSSIDKKALGKDGILLHEALFQAATHLRKAANPVSRRVIIVVTDNISTQKLGRGHSENDALNELFESGGVVCGLNVSNIDATVLKLDPLYYVLKGLLFRGDINTYADKTGGIVLKSKNDELSKRLGELIGQLRSRYAIGYLSSNTKQDGTFRKIKLSLSKEVEKREGKFAIISRRGYFAKVNSSK
jgi:VWFA-related protein